MLFKLKWSELLTLSREAECYVRFNFEKAGPHMLFKVRYKLSDVYLKV